MDQEKVKMIGWVVAGVVVAAIVIYLAVSGGFVGGPSSQIPPGVQTPQGTVVAPGTSPIATSGQVVSKTTSLPVKLNVTPGTPDAPQQSDVVSKGSLPSQAIKLAVTGQGFSPSSFTVSVGQPVVLSVTSGDAFTHVFMFDDPSLSAVAIGVGPGETRAISFNAPKAGTYKFHCDVPGHKDRGETGMMVVE
jgi:uncharacterized cupredoxin-like copper-binding protein